MKHTSLCKSTTYNTNLLIFYCWNQQFRVLIFTLHLHSGFSFCAWIRCFVVLRQLMLKIYPAGRPLSWDRLFLGVLVNDSQCVWVNMCLQCAYAFVQSWEACADGIVLSLSSSFTGEHRNLEHVHYYFIVFFPDTEWLTAHLFSPTGAKRAAGGWKM